MPINSRELLSVISQVTDDANMRVTMKESFRGGCIAGAATMIGGLVLGPAGLAIGGVIGACSAAVMSANKFRPVSHVIMYDMTDAQRQRLVNSVNAVIQNLRVEDAVMLLPLILNNPGTKAAILQSVVQFIQSEMQLQILD